MVGEKMKIETKIKQLEKLLEEIKKLAKNRYETYNCPLRHNHYYLSRMIFGIGSYQWTCGFCGKGECE